MSFTKYKINYGNNTGVNNFGIYYLILIKIDQLCQLIVRYRCLEHSGYDQYIKIHIYTYITRALSTVHNGGLSRTGLKYRKQVHYRTGPKCPLY